MPARRYRIVQHKGGYVSRKPWLTCDRGFRGVQIDVKLHCTLPRKSSVQLEARRRWNGKMKQSAPLLIAFGLGLASITHAQTVTTSLPYAQPPNERQMLDVYAPANAKKLPVVFWIHGGGWVVGDKTSVQVKPKAFVDKGFVFVSTNYRFLPKVDMESIVRDIASSLHWVHDHIGEYGGDPNRILVMGHSAGAQLAALICTDDRYLKAEGLSLAIIKGCVPLDGDTYDVPLIIETAAARRKALGQPDPKFGHYEKFGNDPAKHRDLSAVNHVSRDKGIPPFLILHVSDDPNTTAQAQRLASVLSEAGISTTRFGAKNTNHTKLNDKLGLADDPATKELFAFVDKLLKK
jgi:arylformamidase